MQVQNYLDILTAWIYVYKFCFSNNTDIGTTGSLVIKKIVFKDQRNSQGLHI